MIMKKLTQVLLFTLIAGYAQAQIYLAKECEISFFSKTAARDIEGVNKSAKPILNTANGEIAVKITIQGFKFTDPLMQEHFNENYLESDKIPTSTFSGKVNEKIDYTKDGENKVTVTGKISIHGVERQITLNGTLTVKGGSVLLDTKFMVHLDDYKIKRPSIVLADLAEDIEVKLKATLEAYKK